MAERGAENTRKNPFAAASQSSSSSSTYPSHKNPFSKSGAVGSITPAYKTEAIGNPRTGISSGNVNPFSESLSSQLDYGDFPPRQQQQTAQISVDARMREEPHVGDSAELNTTSNVVFHPSPVVAPSNRRFLSSSSSSKRSVRHNVADAGKKRGSARNDRQFNDRHEDVNAAPLPMSLASRLRWHNSEALAEARVSTTVASVLEEMLCDLEIWDAVNRKRREARALAAKEAKIEALEAALHEEKEAKKQDAAAAKARALEARAIREQLINELWELGKSMKSTVAMERKLEKVEEDKKKIALLERTIETLQRQLGIREGAVAAGLVEPPPLGGSVALSSSSAPSFSATASTANAAAVSASMSQASFASPLGVSGAHVASSNAPKITEPPVALRKWLQGALGGKKWRNVAAEYALKLAQHLQPSLNQFAANYNDGGAVIDVVVRLNAQQLVEYAGCTSAHAVLISVCPRPGAPIAAYSAPFMALEDKVLLKTFSFLKAGSVLSTAQVCKPFFTRVDAIFGMGSSINSPGSLPPPPPTDTTASAPTAALRTADGSVVGSGHPGSAMKIPDQPSKATTPSDSLSKVGIGKTPAMDVELAKKIAAKLDNAEMKGIVQMVERIKRLEGVVGHLSDVKEDTESRLTATESVKEFLVEKLKETEVALKRTVDSANEAARQHQADQEVISFLDSRVQELEAQLKVADEAADGARASLASAASQGSQANRNFEDILRVEKERFGHAEAEAKAQKKLLVKEVKNLRGQLASIVAERDAYKRQLSTGGGLYRGENSGR